MITTPKRTGRAVQSAAVFIGTFVLLLFFSCEQPGKDTAEQGGGGVGRSALSPSPGFTEADLLLTFGLTRGGITASAAAEKIRDKAGSGTGEVTFTKKEIISYDDEAGVFAVHVKGTKNGKKFDETLTVRNFPHPYMGTTLGALEYQEGGYLVFTKAIEENLSLDEFIKAASKTDGVGYVSFSYELDNGKGKKAVVGQHSEYSLTAHLRKTKDNKVKIMAVYTLNFKKYIKENNVPVDPEPTSVKSVSDSTDYFTRDDVFKHILNEVKNDEDFIQTVHSSSPSGEPLFASEFYAAAVTKDATPAGLFDKTKLQKYIEKYENKGSTEHLELPNIDVAILNPRGGGIKADDFAGTLSLTYYIATRDLITKEDTSKFVPAPEETVKAGFRKIDEGTAKKLFDFNLLPSDTRSNAWDTWNNWWDSRKFDSEKILVKENGTFSDEQWLTASNSFTRGHPSGYYLCLHGIEDFIAHDYLADKNSSFLSKGLNDELIFVKNITISKADQKPSLKIKMTFLGINSGEDGKPIEIMVTPPQPNSRSSLP